MPKRIYDSIVKTEPVTKGLSGDKKYRAAAADGVNYLLRVSPIDQLANKKTLFSMMEQAAAQGVPMCRPMEFGTCDGGQSVYQLLTWCEGGDLDDILPTLSEAEKYIAGLRAGEILRKIHSVPAPEGLDDWSVRYLESTEDRLRWFGKSGVEIEGSGEILRFFEENKALLKGRPQCLLHGDFHTGNLLVTENLDISVIDWELLDFGNYGDPWAEFNRINHSGAEPYFSTGLIRGYFGGEPPAEFWKILALYLSAGALMLVSWAFYRQRDCLDECTQTAKDIIRWFDNMKNPVPAWYLRKFYVQLIDGVPCRLKEPFDFSFLKEYGKVFKVFDGQSSGCVCFGVFNGARKFFIKLAGVQTVNNHDLPVSDAVARLRAAVPKYKELAHPLLIRFIEGKAVGGGFVTVFDWEEGVSFSAEALDAHERFSALPIAEKMRVFEEILRFHEHVARCGYVAIDFNDCSTLYNFATGEVKICDVDFYAKQSYINGMGKALGDPAVMSPEEYRIGGLIDEVTNVYTMGATAFVLFTNNDRSPEAWPLSKGLYDVAKKAISDERGDRQQSITRLITEWRAAK